MTWDCSSRWSFRSCSCLDLIDQHQPVGVSVRADVRVRLHHPYRDRVEIVVYAHVPDHFTVLEGGHEEDIDHEPDDAHVAARDHVCAYEVELVAVIVVVLYRLSDDINDVRQDVRDDDVHP